MMTAQAREEHSWWTPGWGAPLQSWVRGVGGGSFRRELHSQTAKLDEPDIDTGDRNFVVAIPVTGGLDSSTCYEMAKDAGLPVQAFYVDTGADYSGDEQAQLTMRGIPYTPLHVKVDYKHDRMIDFGRNAVILWTVAEHAFGDGRWGEIWFGGHMGPAGESPIRGGDKSHRFLLTINQLLTMDDHDARVVSPLEGMTKADMVRWWLDHRTLTEAMKTWSCFDPVASMRCGRCNACFRWWVAFAAHGIPTHNMNHLWAKTPRWPSSLVVSIGQEIARADFSPGRLAPFRDALRHYSEEVIE